MGVSDFLPTVVYYNGSKRRKDPTRRTLKISNCGDRVACFKSTYEIRKIKGKKN